MKVNCNLILRRRTSAFILKRHVTSIIEWIKRHGKKFVCIHFGKTRVSPQQTFQPKENSRHVVVRPFSSHFIFSNARKILCSRLGLKSRYHSAKSRNASQFTMLSNRLLCIRNLIVKGWKARAFHVKFMSFSIEIFTADSAAFSCIHCRGILQNCERTCAKLFCSRTRKAPLVVCMMGKFISRALKNEFQSLDVLIISRSPQILCYLAWWMSFKHKSEDGKPSGRRVSDCILDFSSRFLILSPGKKAMRITNNVTRVLSASDKKVCRQLSNLFFVNAWLGIGQPSDAYVLSAVGFSSAKTSMNQLQASKTHLEREAKGKRLC